ncbi:MAG: ATP-binding cassette domain-containing protein [Bacteroidetes bacterium]|jgi:ABC-type glutathione transport system ATPase component|nr:ATP-binding cassette domain-containing protein [Bacteroidota bacterium]
MLSVEQLTIKLNKSGRTIVNSVNFKLFGSNIYSIIGKNGEGKTVMLKSLTRLLDEEVFSIDGSVRFNDTNILMLDNTSLLGVRRSIRYLFQDAVNTFDPLKKISYYFDEKFIKDRKKIPETFNNLLLTPVEKILNSFPYELSTGQAQRVSFALALLGEPNILILDEPTSALDPINANLFKIVLSDYIKKDDRLVLIVTHDINFAEKISNKIAFMHLGKLTEFENPSLSIKKYNEIFLKGIND